jgi:GPN-loop GTPase
LENIDWIFDKIQDYQDDYLIFDCPGQIELYSHYSIFPNIVKHVQRIGYSVCCVYCLESQFIEDTSKFISGTFMCLSAMISFETPHVNVLTKCDLLQDKEISENVLIPNEVDLLDGLNKSTAPKFRKLNASIASLISEYSLVSFIPLDLTDEESIEYLLSTIDNAIQYGEDLEPKDPYEQDQNNDEFFNNE